MIRSIRIIELGQYIGSQAMSSATVRYYMSKGFKLRLNKDNQPELVR